nr:immunoglobulin heavy chain junction region [Mus musculus]
CTRVEKPIYYYGSSYSRGAMDYW